MKSPTTNVGDAIQQHAQKHSSETDTQVAIIGGGSAGACCALALRQCGVKHITVIESSCYDQFRIGESIPPESKPLMLQLGIWQAFLNEQHEPCYGSRSWWGDERRGYNDSLLNPLGHGWHLDRVKFNRFLALQTEAAQVSLLTGYQFCSAEHKSNGGYTMQLLHGKHSHVLTADFVIDASGAKGVFAKSQGSHKLFSSPLVCSSRLFEITDSCHPLSGLTHLEAVDTGWWYAARLPHNKLLLSHNTDGDTFKNLRMKNSQYWEAELQRSSNTYQFIEGCHPLDDNPVIYSTPSFVLDKMIGTHWLSIGDAASCYDTITSQGIIKSMSDGVSVANEVARYLQNKDYSVLERYQSYISQRHQQYRHMRDYYYRQEGRFKNNSFWKKMHSLQGQVVNHSMRA